MIFAKVAKKYKEVLYLLRHKETYDFSISPDVPKEDRWAYYWLAAINKDYSVTLSNTEV